MKKSVLITLLLCSILLLPGCWNRVEIEDRAIVAAIGFDKAAEEGKVEVTAQIIKPGEIKPGDGGGDGGGEAVVVYSGTGYDVFDAVRGMAREVGRKLYFAETQAMVIGEDLAREGVDSVMDLLSRDAEPKVRMWVLVTRGTARKVLETPIPTEKIWGLDWQIWLRPSERIAKRRPWTSWIF